MSTENRLEVIDGCRQKVWTVPYQLLLLAYSGLKKYGHVYFFMLEKWTGVHFSKTWNGNVFYGRA